MTGADRGDHTGCAQRNPEAGTPVLMLHATASTGGRWLALAAGSPRHAYPSAA